MFLRVFVESTFMIIIVISDSVASDLINLNQADIGLIPSEIAIKCLLHVIGL